MISPVSVVKLLREKGQFVKNHPTFYSFLKGNFGKGVSKGTIIEIKVKRPDGEEEVETAKLQESDIPLFEIIKEFLE